MYFHLILTVSCNSECRYCYKKSCADFGNKLGKKWEFDFVPEKADYSIQELKKFLNRNSSEEKHVLTFYGGEPLLEIKKIEEIMDNVNSRFMIQTNGKLLDRVEKRYLDKFDMILVSIDGNKQLTDMNRGEGTYDKIISNVRLIRELGFKREIIARMVVDEYSSLLNSVKHLFDVGFDAVHWQLDAGFYANDFAKRNFSDFMQKYNHEVSELVEFWAERMKQGKVLKIYPFLGVFDTLYYERKAKLMCGSGHSNYTINTNGKISVCPIMHDVKNYYVGDIKKDSPENLPEYPVKGFCEKCRILSLCGGRCLYASEAELWPKEGQSLICGSVNHLISEIKGKIPEISELIKKGIVSEKDFEYEKYSGPEIIP